MHQAMPEQPRICLTMIVKDEAAIIERCLAAAAPWIDSYCILDTGSTDGTPDLIRSFFTGLEIPGEVHLGEFHDFAQARNDALAAARDSAQASDYLLLCDADMELTVDDPSFKHALSADAYLVLQRGGGYQYANLRMMRRDLPATYRGVTHEHLDLGGHRAEQLDGLWFLDHAEGSSRAVKYERDLDLLTRGLEEEPDNARYVFYLAQTHRDLGQHREALAAYLRRTVMGGWDEEVWYATFQVAVLHERLHDNDDTVLGAYLAAYELRPTRAEPLVELARYCREHGPRHHLSHLFASRALQIALPADRLFLDAGAYGWRVLDELAIASYWIGSHEESATRARAALAHPELPPEHRARIEKNLGYAQRELGRATPQP